MYAHVSAVVLLLAGYYVMYDKKEAKGRAHFWSVTAVSWHALVGGAAIIMWTLQARTGTGCLLFVFVCLEFLVFFPPRRRNHVLDVIAAPTPSPPFSLTHSQAVGSLYVMWPGRSPKDRLASRDQHRLTGKINIALAYAGACAPCMGYFFVCAFRRRLGESPPP